MLLRSTVPTDYLGIASVIVPSDRPRVQAIPLLRGYALVWRRKLSQAIPPPTSVRSEVDPTIRL